MIRLMRHRKFNLWCFLFGHRWAFPFETTDYRVFANGLPSGCRSETKKTQRRKIVKRWHKCDRCGEIEKIGEKITP